MDRSPLRERGAPDASAPGSAGERGIWAAALGSFVVAAATGVILRFGLVVGLPDALTFENLRHAHSHLMCLGWVTPPLMLLIGRDLRTRGGRIEGLVAIAAVALAGGALAYPAFLVAGYSAVDLVGVRMPVSVLAASVGGVAWYVFVWRYLGARRWVPGDGAVRLWDGAVVFLALAPLSAMARGIVDATGVGGPEAGAAAIGAFLTWLGEGWFVLGVLGLVWAAHPGDERLGRWGRRLVLAGLSTAFLLHVPPHALHPALRVGAITGGLLLAAGLLVLAAALQRPAGTWPVLPALLAFAAAGRAALAVPAIATGPAGAGMRILGLHVVMLGVVTLGLVASARRRWGDAAGVRPATWTAAVVMLLVTLAPASGLLGAPGPGSRAVAAVGSVPLALVAIRDLGRALVPDDRMTAAVSSVRRASVRGDLRAR